jgi:hypothetical protein
VAADLHLARLGLAKCRTPGGFDLRSCTAAAGRPGAGTHGPGQTRVKHECASATQRLSACLTGTRAVQVQIDTLLIIIVCVIHHVGNGKHVTRAAATGNAACITPHTAASVVRKRNASSRCFDRTLARPPCEQNG